MAGQVLGKTLGIDCLEKHNRYIRISNTSLKTVKKKLDNQKNEIFANVLNIFFFF